MSLDKQKSLSAMRTFARDLDRERSGDETHTPSPKPIEKKEIEEKQPKVYKGENITVIDKKEKKEVPNKIPAFHELQKSKKVKSSKISKKGKQGITTNRPMGGGTIITDTKNEKKPFFGELVISLERWFKEVKKSLEPKKKNTYAVSTTDRRKGVVQKATSKTGTIFSADNETLKEQIKERQRAEQKKDDGEDVTWSPFTETGFPLLEDGDETSVDPRIKNVAVTFIKKSVPEKPKKIEEKKDESKKQIPVIKKFVEPEPVEKPEPVELEEKQVKEVFVEPEPVEIEEIIPEISQEIDLEEEYADDESPEEIIQPIRSLSDVLKSDTNTQTVLLVGVLAICLLFAFAIYSAITLMNTPTTDFGIEIQTQESFAPGANQKTITINTGTFNEIVQQTNTAFIQNQDMGLTEYRYVTPKGNEVSVTTLLEIIDPQSTVSFMQSITGMRFIQTASNDRALILKTNDNITALGGMLNWEETMYADIGSILGTSNVSPSAGEFTDTQFGSSDVRALVFDNETLLLYTFKDDAHIIIANDIAALIPLIQN